jgi:hexokinase
MKLQSNGLYSAAAIEFMKRSGMHQDNVDLEKSLEKYLYEMEKGLRGKSRLPMVPTYIHGDIQPARGKKALAVDVGGTNLRLALVELDALGRVRVYGLKKERLPGLNERISSDFFFDSLASFIAPYYQKADIISFSFAHEIQHLKGMDGRVLALSKELSVEGIEGQLLGERLEQSLESRGCAGARIIVLNDTVGVAGCMAHKLGEYGSLIGLVMGTGTNTCYIERSNNIEKINDAEEESMFINVESAEFDPVSRGLFDRMLDDMTDAPGAAVLEKMISGRYVGNLFWLAVRQAALDGLLSKGFTEALGGDMLDTIAMSAFLADPYNGVYSDMCKTQSDRAFLYTVAQTLVLRGAKLIALEIAGAAIKTGMGQSSEKPVCVVAEGTTYYTLKGLKAETERIIKTWLEPKGVYVILKKIDNAAIKGIGLIGLSYL